MNWTVDWVPEADDHLAAVWLAATDRNAVTAAAARIEQALRDDPVDLGSPSFDTVRIVEYPPLGVEFEVIDDDHTVVVLTVWDTATGRPAPTGN